MRTTFLKELIEAARGNDRIFLVVGDLGYSVVEPFAEEFPNRFLNAGVAEQNMTGVAAGLASEGYHVFTYSIANFPTLRCLEQIRNDVCYHQLPVTVVSVGGGMAYGSLGYSHHAVQDLGIMLTLPGMKVFAPGDPGQVKAAVHYLVAHPSPSYLRLGKAGEKDYTAAASVEIERPIRVMGEGTKVAVVTTGGILDLAAEIHTEFTEQGVPASVYSSVCLSALNTEVCSVFSDADVVVTIEEHVATGGLGQIIKTLLPSDSVISFSVPHELSSEVGSQAYLRKEAGLESHSIVKRVLDALG